MDDDAELIDALCTRIGMIMEDASVVALSRGRGDRDDRLAQLAAAIEQMSALAGAAQAIRRA
jgi:hypothetical protein